MKYPRYPAYKDSKIQWIGEIPEHWMVKRLKHTAHPMFEKGNHEAEQVALENIEGWSGKYVPTETEFAGDGIRFEIGDVLFGKLRPYLAKVYRAEFQGEAVGEFFVLRSAANINSKFLSYWLLNEDFINVVDSSTFGAKMPRVDWIFMGNLPTAVPPESEQRDISESLSYEITKIDSSISKQQRLIELFKEKRQAIITHVVTKGLDPNVPMKDSGIEWIGEIPEDWEITPLKRLMTCNDEVLSENTHPDSELKYIEISDVSDGNGITNIQEIIFSEAPSRARRIVRDGDIIISTVRTYLRAIASVQEPEHNTVVSTGFAVLRPRKISGGFAKYALSADYFIEEVISESTGVSYPSISSEKMITFKIAVPDKETQFRITKSLDKTMNVLSSLISKQEQMIELLKEHKSSLISNAVTGKIDVRGLVKGVTIPAGQTP